MVIIIIVTVFRVHGKDYKKRAITRVPLKLSGKFEFGVAVYALCRSASRPSYIKIDSRTNEEVKTVTKMICEVSRVHLPLYHYHFLHKIKNKSMDRVV